MTFAVLAGYCAHCPPISRRGGGILWCPPWKGLGGQASAVFLLPSAAQGRTAAEKGQSHVWCGKRANHTYIQVQLVHYSTFEPVVLQGGGPTEAVGVQTLYEPSPTPILYVARGLASNVLGRVLVKPLFLLGLLRSSHTSSISTARQVPRRANRCSRRVGQEGKQRLRLRGEPMAVAVWAGQTSSGGPVGGWHWLRLRSGTSQWWRMPQRRQWQPGSEGAARLPRRQEPEAEWNEDIPRISLIQISVIEISIG